MQLDELKKRIDNLTIGLKREEALEIFTFLTKADFDSTFVKSKIKKERWDEFEKVKLLLDEDSRNAEGEGVKHAGSRLFDCTVKLELKPSSEKAENKIKHSTRWSDFEKAALIVDNLFDKQKTEIDQLKSQQKRDKASLLSFIRSVFDKHLLPFQKDQFKSFFPNYISLFNLIELIFPNKIQDKEIEVIFLKGEPDNKKFPWYVRELHKLANPEDKLKFSTILQFGSWFDIETTLNISDEQQTEIDEFLKNNFEKNYDFDKLINELINHSKTLTATQKETITVAHTEILGNTDRASKRKRKPSQKATEQNPSKAETSEEERSEKNLKKKQKISPEAKATETLSDSDRERIIAQIRIALDEMWEKNGGKKFGSTHSPKFQTVDKKEYLIFKMLIKPDAQCKTNEEKIAFGKKVELFLKNEFHLQQNTQTNNFKLIEYDIKSKKGIFDLEWNRYCIKEKKTASEKLIGFTLRPKKWEENPGAVIVRGSTTATIEKKLEDFKLSLKKTSITETSATPEITRELSDQPSSPPDLFKEAPESREQSEDENIAEDIEDAPTSPELVPKPKKVLPVVDLEGEINESDEESKKLWEELQKVTAENQQDEQTILQTQNLLKEKTMQLQQEKQKKHSETKRKIAAELKRQQEKRTKLLSDKEKAEQELQKTEIKLASYRGGPT